MHHWPKIQIIDILKATPFFLSFILRINITNYSVNYFNIKKKKKNERTTRMFAFYII